MSTIRTGRLAVVPASVALALTAWTGTAAANANDVTATCEGGFAFSMPRGETGTRIITTLDGKVMRDDTIATFDASLAYTLPPGDQTIPHSWVVTIDSLYNTDQTIVRAVGACVTPPTTTTVPAAPTTTAPPQVATSTVPTPAATSIVPATTTTVPAVVTDLPATGAMTDVLGFLAAALVAGGATLLRIRRMGAR